MESVALTKQSSEKLPVGELLMWKKGPWNGSCQEMHFRLPAYIIYFSERKRGRGAGFKLTDQFRNSSFFIQAEHLRKILINQTGDQEGAVR